jgi:dUTP pyrophosphatase
MEAVTIEFFKLREDAILPEYSHKGDSGFKLSIPDDVRIELGETRVIPLGWACRIPDGWEMQIRSRSGMTSKVGLVVAQGTGTIDSSYRGEVGAIVYNRGVDDMPDDYRYNGMVGYDGSLMLPRGTNVAQGVICEVPDVIFKEVYEWDENETTRGSGGYGSTDEE